MKIEHIAVWVDDIEQMRAFYLAYFNLRCGEKYTNPAKRYTSYFLTFYGGEARIELMHKPDIADNNVSERGFRKGLAHISISLGGKEAVNTLTERLRKDGYAIVSEPRTTGDGYYESTFLDPEGNYIELLE